MCCCREKTTTSNMRDVSPIEAIPVSADSHNSSPSPIDNILDHHKLKKYQFEEVPVPPPKILCTKFQKLIWITTL
jgi:hypothetical protein